MYDAGCGGIEMAKLWILRGAHEAPGWNQLRKAYEDEKVEIIHLDAKVWAIIDAEEEPSGYEGTVHRCSWPAARS